VTSHYEVRRRRDEESKARTSEKQAVISRRRLGVFKPSARPV
jgi:hypothetical protein